MLESFERYQKYVVYSRRYLIMKCENCGKNEVTFVYQSNVNGQVEEKHL